MFWKSSHSVSIYFVHSVPAFLETGLNSSKRGWEPSPLSKTKLAQLCSCLLKQHCCWRYFCLYGFHTVRLSPMFEAKQNTVKCWTFFAALKLCCIDLDWILYIASPVAMLEHISLIYWLKNTIENLGVKLCDIAATCRAVSKSTLGTCAGWSVTIPETGQNPETAY